MAVVRPHWGEPDLRRVAASFHMNVRGFSAIARVEEEVQSLLVDLLTLPLKLETLEHRPMSRHLRDFRKEKKSCRDQTDEVWGDSPSKLGAVAEKIIEA